MIGDGGQTVDLAALTGVRSGKRSYYREFVRSDERLARAVQAMDSISRALVRTVEGPRSLLEEVVRAASSYLDAQWTVLALGDGELSGARPRFLVLGASGDPLDDDATLPPHVRRELDAIRSGEPSGSNDPWVRVTMTLEGRRVGCLAGLAPLTSDLAVEDLAVLRILANQAAVSLHTSEQYRASVTLHRRAQRLYDEAQAGARDLEARTRELRQVEQRLLLAHQRELIDSERHRIARELHDSVTQYVLSAGMAVEVARGEAAGLGTDADAIHERLEIAKNLSQRAVEQLRRAIYALHQPHQDTVSSLPELLQEVASHHRPHLAVNVRVVGAVIPLTTGADHEIARAVGEALFNVVTHARATRTVIRLRYRPDELLVSVADDGQGDPKALSTMLRLERNGTADGRHRGLANIEARLTELGGTVSFRKARIGGVRVEMRLPLPLNTIDDAGIIAGLVGAKKEES